MKKRKANEPNFVCPKCGKREWITSFSIRGDKYYEKNSLLVSDCCKVEMEYVEMERDGFSINVNRFDSLSSSDKKKILAKRSSEHYKKEIRERKEDMNKNYW